MIILFATLVLLKVGTAFATPASELHETCTSEIDRDYSFGFCSGYVAAIAEQQDGFCIPRGVYVEHLMQQVLPLLSAMPDRHASLVVRDALARLLPMRGRGQVIRGLACAVQFSIAHLAGLPGAEKLDWPRSAVH